VRHRQRPRSLQEIKSWSCASLRGPLFHSRMS
jgi:hypothetical protein